MRQSYCTVCFLLYVVIISHPLLVGCTEISRKMKLNDVYIVAIVLLFFFRRKTPPCKCDLVLDTP